MVQFRNSGPTHKSKGQRRVDRVRLLEYDGCLDVS